MSVLAYRSGDEIIGPAHIDAGRREPTPDRMYLERVAFCGARLATFHMAGLATLFEWAQYPLDAESEPVVDACPGCWGARPPGLAMALRRRTLPWAIG